MTKNNLTIFILAILSIDIIIIILHIYLSQHSQLGTLFDLDQEANLPTWYTSFKLTLAGVVALLIYDNEKRYDNEKKSSSIKSQTWFWLFIALLMFFMSADETAQIHETLTRWFMQTIMGLRLLHSLEIGKSGGTLLWGLIFSPLLILIAASLLNFYLQRFKKNRILIILTLMMISFFVASFLLEQQEAHIAGQLNQISHAQLKHYQLMTLIEESCELFATSLLLTIHFYFFKTLYHSETEGETNDAK
jgi:hypothetical protein